MNQYNFVPLYQGSVHREICENNSYTEMREYDYCFLLGLLSQSQPRKIVEVGVAAGVTSAVILSWLSEAGLKDTELISVDISRDYYWNKDKRTGFFCEEWKSSRQINNHHQYFLGEQLSYVVKEIKGNVDFLILDTTHYLPGELLEFLIWLPYLSNTCMVVVHDVALSHVQLVDARAIATKLLFDVVSAERFFLEDPEYGRSLSNIAAFSISDDTRINIINVFSALQIGWEYIPSPCDMISYVEIIKEKYDGYLSRMFTDTLEWQKYSVTDRLIRTNYRGNLESLKQKWRGDSVYIFGCGKWGTLYYYFAKANNLDVKGMVVSTVSSRDSARERFDCPVLTTNELIMIGKSVTVLFALSDENYEDCRGLFNGYDWIKEL